MKANDFMAGEHCVPIVPSDTIDNVVFTSATWFTATPYPKGTQVTYLGVNWIALLENTSVVPVEGATWTRFGAPEAIPVPSIIYCDGLAGTIKVTTFGGDVISTSIAALGLLMQGKLKVKRVWSTGTTATVLYAIAI